jgi:hypothetical protein
MNRCFRIYSHYREKYYDLFCHMYLSEQMMRLVLKVIMQNDRDVIEIILL